MCPPPPIAAATAEPSLGEVVRCERIKAGLHTALVRVTIALNGTSPSALAGAQLVVEDRGHVLRCDALPAPAPARGPTVTLGFAAPATATPLGLVVGGRSLALAETGDARRVVEDELRATRARLDVSRGDCAALKRARSEALQAAARAEAAAHDANARAAALERRLPVPRLQRRSSRVAVVAACTLGPAALLVAILAWPARDDGKRGVGGVPEAVASSARPSRAATTTVDRLAARLRIPADYLGLYREAAARYGLDWARLAAIGEIESGHGQIPLAGVVTGANDQGASGPAQFMPGTWERFGVDGDDDGDRDPHSPADAIHAMASYLRASGAPQDWRAALRTYNHSDAYVDAVESLATRLRGSAA